ncbi:FxsA family protein [Nocardioides coralli]|uniref:FxsA family protein n=1 Tax=Nocardioides coralli TaxID=2872154 RepID=UPI00201814B7|nr:FxsA family protein [Nocardioides coralli]
MLRVLLVVAFVGVPLLEIYLLIVVGRVIGAWWTLLLLVLASVLGAWLVRREGGRTWRALTEALRTGRMPARELADGALVLIGGTLMLTPGFATDAVGLLLVLPFSRPVARRALTAAVSRRLLGTDTGRRPGPPTGGPVVRGDVVDE